MDKIIGCIVLCFFVACSSGKPEQPATQTPAGQQEISAAKGQYVLQIIPKEADKNTSGLSAVAQGFNLSEADVEWLVNGVRVPDSAGAKFYLSYPKKGDKVQARAFFQEQEILSDVVTVKNAPPEMKRIRIMPEVFKPGEVLYVDAQAEDADGDDVTIAYEWSINEEPAGTAKQIEGTIKRGDKITIKITPFDGESYGRPAIIKREIRNLPPVITADNKFTMKAGLYLHQVKAADPDGDTLVYSLKSAPKGMTIDQGTGLIRWNVPPDFKGKQTFTVSVSDGNGGEANQDFVFRATSE